MINFFVNEKKGIVVARLDVEETGKFFIGKSKCSPTDSFDQVKGKNLAKLRAIRSYLKTERNFAKVQHKQAQAVANSNKAYVDHMENRVNKIEHQIEECLKTL